MLEYLKIVIDRLDKSLIAKRQQKIVARCVKVVYADRREGRA